MSFLSMNDVHKRFGGVVALAGAHLEGERGEVHALVGPNGSGKSTLDKTLTGVVAPDRADIVIDGERVSFSSPREAQRHGIAAVYQELSLVGPLSVVENVALGVEPTGRFGFVDRAARRDRARGVLERFAAVFGGGLPLDEPVEALSAGEQQIVEICKAIARQPRILVLDEATASLRHAQVEALFEVVRELRDDGVLVIFTSHRLDEVFGVCDRATVLRGGKTVGTVELDQVSESDLVSMMLGRELRHAARAAPGTDERTGDGRPVVFEVDGLTSWKVDDVSLDLREGEILGLGGLQGQGQSELLRALFGAEKTESGSVRLGGRELRLRSPGHAVQAGIALIPGERGREGLFPVRPILENLALASMRRRTAVSGVLVGSREEDAAKGAVERLQIKIGDLDDIVATLSGGNQQKVVVGRWLLTEPRVVLMDDPTKGIDVGAKEELFDLMRSLTESGVAIIFNSSENQELLALSDRILVLYEGQVVDELAGADRTEDRLLAASMRVRADA